MKKAALTLLMLATFSYLYSANFKDMTNIQEEIWKSVPEYEGFYEASTSGRIRSITRRVDKAGACTVGVQGRILHTGINRGYLQVKLYSKLKFKKSIKVHRVIALTFIPYEYCAIVC